MNKPPKNLFTSGEAVRAFRKKAGLNQQEFWSKIDITQPGGSRYEAGRKMPKQVLHLLHLAYGTSEQAEKYLAWLRRTPE
jgi:transcriptional regulator with XRE-family HTH domain